LGTPQPWEATVGAILEETGRKTKLSGYSITLESSRNSFYSSYTPKAVWVFPAAAAHYTTPIRSRASGATTLMKTDCSIRESHL
jgi:hypothetical protein